MEKTKNKMLQILKNKYFEYKDTSNVHDYCVACEIAKELLNMTDEEIESYEDKWHKEYYKEEIVRHLWVISLKLQCAKQPGKSCPGKIATSVTQHNTSYRRWYECQCDKFPYMTRSDYNDEISREPPTYRSQQCDIPLHFEA